MSVTPILQVDDLAIAYKTGDREQRVVHGVSFSVAPGEVVALVGESGSGKTTTAQATLGLLAGNGRVESGTIRLNGTDITNWSQKRLDSIRGAVVSLIPQDPGSSLNPVRTIGAQLAEVMQIHKRGDRKAIQARVIELLERVGLTPAEMRARQYPHELSGGMKQRVLIAIAVALKPALIVADEPTSALDVTVQRRILDLIDELRRESGTAVLLVTHDLGVAADRADRLVVLQNGRIQEQGAVKEVLATPRSAYTRRLLADAPSLGKPRPARAAAESQDFAIEVTGLTHDFPVTGGEAKSFRAVDDVSFKVRRGTTHAIVGESGSGKTTAIRSVVGFIKPTAGRILIDGVDLTTLKGEALRQFRKHIQLVYQNPYGSLDPRQTIARIVEEPLLNFEPIPAADRARKVRDMLAGSGFPRASWSAIRALCRAASGSGSPSPGPRARSARAGARRGGLGARRHGAGADPVAARRAAEDAGLTYLFVSHDLAVVRQISDTVSVMHKGRQVDGGPIETVFGRPDSAYTRELIEAIPGRSLPVTDLPALAVPPEHPSRLSP